MAKSVVIKARGKVNLSLNITGVRGGMHMLDSVTASVSLCDKVTVAFRDDGKVNVRFVSRVGACDIPEKNSVTKAVAFLRGFYPELGADVTVEKGIPEAGGVGGSSADAAAVIEAARILLPQKLGAADIVKESVAIGSDVPVMCVGGIARLSGVGEHVERLKYARLHLVVAKCGAGVTSKDAYASFDRLYPSKAYAPSDNDALINALACGELAAVAHQLHNALTLPAAKLCPDIEFTLSSLRATNCAAAFMTGSGNCCCGLYAGEDEATAAVLCLRGRGLWAEYAATEQEGCSVL